MQLTVIITSDTYIAGQPVMAGTEKTYTVEEDSTTNQIIGPEELQHLKASGRIVEKDSIGHRQFIKAREVQSRKESPALATKR